MENEFLEETSSIERWVMAEWQELWEEYRLCRGRLRQVAKEVEALRQENGELRSENRELVEQLSLLSEVNSYRMMREDSLCDEFRRLSSSATMIHRKGCRRNIDSVPVQPKSISVRSSCYLKMNSTSTAAATATATGRSNKTASPQYPLMTNALSSPTLRTSDVPRGRGRGGGRSAEGEAAATATAVEVEMEVYSQGTFKTELCNKWQENGTCPYGDLCQFAHGITELRPIIRHPRYKTQVCRMVLAGATCPYGHRCHFRHSLCPPN